MNKSTSTTVLIGILRQSIEYDLQSYEAGKRSGFYLLEYAQDVGMVAPLNWIDRVPEWAEKWYKFMEGQTVCMAGAYVSDLSRFLSVVEKSNKL